MKENNSSSSSAEQPEVEKSPSSAPQPVRFPSMGDLCAMLGITLGSQIIMSVMLILWVLLMGGDFDLKTVDPSLLGRVMSIGYLFSMCLSLAGICYYRYKRGGGSGLGNFSLRGFNPALLLWAFVFMFAAGVVIEPVLAHLPAPSTRELGRGFWTFLMLVGFAPLFEELICRGIVLGSMRNRYGLITAWLGSSLFFAVLHLQPTLVVNAFVLGLILGFIYIATESLWAVIILHALNNGVAYLFLVNGHSEVLLVDLIGDHTLYMLVYIAALAAVGVSGFMTWRTLSRLKAQEEAQKNQPQA